MLLCNLITVTSGEGSDCTIVFNEFACNWDFEYGQIKTYESERNWQNEEEDFNSNFRA